jgi:hypothetical protein
MNHLDWTFAYLPSGLSAVAAQPDVQDPALFDSACYVVQLCGLPAYFDLALPPSPALPAHGANLRRILTADPTIRPLLLKYLVDFLIYRPGHAELAAKASEVCTALVHAPDMGIASLARQGMVLASQGPVPATGPGTPLGPVAPFVLIPWPTQRAADPSTVVQHKVSPATDITATEDVDMSCYGASYDDDLRHFA